jgi:hypothetical protein
MNGKQMPTELTVKEYMRNERFRLVAESHGTVWDSLFVVTGGPDRARPTLTMDARSERLLTRLMVFLFSGVVARAIGRDMNTVKAWCER